MITVIREKPEPRRRVTCSNCGSELEYGNADLCKEEGPLPAGYAYIHSFYFHCPVCRCKEYVDWITQDTDVENNVEDTTCSQDSDNIGESNEQLAVIALNRQLDFIKKECERLLQQSLKEETNYE